MQKRESNIAKGLAVIFMYLHHLFGIEKKWGGEYQIQTIVFSEPQMMQISAALKICVAIFVFITAYGICRSLSSREKKQKSINQYVLIRYVKLFAGFWYIYIVARVSTIFFDGRSPAVIYGSGKQGILHTIIDAFGLARYFETPTLCSTWWYMSLAIILIVLIPILRMIYQKVGGAVLIISVIMLPSVLGMKGSANINIYAYLLSCALGIAASESLWFEKLEKVIVKKQMLWTFNIMCTVVFFAALYFRITVGVKTVFAVNALCALMIVFLSRFCFVKIPGLNYILEKIGKHSMNLFLMHTFFYSYYFDTFIYSFKYPVLIVTVLLIVTMLASIALELVKKLIHYDEGVNYICRKLECMS